MIRKTKGFTLIELLIVVAIIGILAALLIPNIMSAIQRGRQKGTMGDIHTLATNLTDYITENGSFGNNTKDWDTISQGDLDFLVPFYAKKYPLYDKWGHSLYIGLGATSAEGYELTSDDEFAIGSTGRDTDFQWSWDGSIDYGDYESGADFYYVKEMDDFKGDIVNVNGSFVCAPETAVSTGS